MSDGSQLLSLIIATVSVAFGLAAFFVPWYSVESAVESSEYIEVSAAFEYYFNEFCQTISATVESEDDTYFVRQSTCINYGALRHEDSFVSDDINSGLADLETSAHIVVLALGICIASLGLLIGMYCREYPHDAGAKLFVGCMLVGGALLAASLAVMYYDLVEPTLSDDGLDIDYSKALGLIFVILSAILSWVAAIFSCLAPACSEGGGGFGGGKMQMTTIRGR